MAATIGKKGSKISFSNEIEETVNPASQVVKKDNSSIIENSLKNTKGGRPSKGKVKKISLSVPIELMEGIETGAALFFKGNKTAFINALIKKDIEKNLDKYKEYEKIFKK